MNKRKRFLREDELGRFIAAVDSLRSPLARDYFLMCLYTGARRENVAAMRKDELQVKDAIWLVPKEKFKTKGDSLIVLPPPAIEIIKRRMKSDSPWIFPSHGKSGHYKHPKDAWEVVMKRAGLTDVRLHDVRRTFGSWQVKLGTPLPTISASLGHLNLSSTEDYAHSDISLVQESVSAVVEAMLRTRQKDSEKGGK